MKKKAQQLWLKIFTKAHNSYRFQLAYQFNKDCAENPTLKNAVLEHLKKKKHRNYLLILEMEKFFKAIQQKNPTTLFTLDKRIPRDFLAFALLQIGPSSIPSAIRCLKNQKNYKDPYLHQKIRASLIALALFKEKKTVQPIWRLSKFSKYGFSELRTAKKCFKTLCQKRTALLVRFERS